MAPAKSSVHLSAVALSAAMQFLPGGFEHSMKHRLARNLSDRCSQLLVGKVVLEA